MAPECSGCAKAAIDPRTVYFNRSCKECDARSLAQSPAYFDSARAGEMTETYRSALKYVFGAMGVKEGHEQVKVWAEKISSRSLESRGPAQ